VVFSALAVGVLSGCSSTAGPATPSGDASEAPAAATDAPGLDAGAASRESQHIVGKITEEKGATWTMRGDDGKTYAVTLTPTTKFGTTKHPKTAGQFPVGSVVEAKGAVSGTSVQATEIRPPHKTYSPN
jgi:hypothetical protein